MKKKIIFNLFLTSLTLLVLVGCSSADDSSSDWAPSAQAPDLVFEMEEAAEDTFDWADDWETDEISGMAVEEEERIFGSIPILSAEESGRQLSYTVTFTLETTEFLRGVQMIWETVAQMSGYAEYEYIIGRSIRNPHQERTARFELRIPNEQLGAFLEFIEANYTILSYRRILDDFTFIYERQDAQLTNLREQEDRLLADLEDDGDRDEIERDLANIQSQIRNLEESNTIIQRDVDYSDVSIRLNEVIIVVPEEEEPPTFAQRLQEALDGTLEALFSTFQVLMIVAATVFPWLLLIAIVIVPVILIVKKQNRKKIWKNQKSDE